MVRSYTPQIESIQNRCTAYRLLGCERDGWHDFEGKVLAYEHECDRSGRIIGMVACCFSGLFCGLLVAWFAAC